ncbi:hypothetical protein Bca52824_026757 [Brassica carinata]|uniref:Uncharacterized protein n=1 Tax=Brassica carinata TaxID=52824 RepID=A0A8X7SH91_BRACI|nr:hypothetical protein Bca52824_026757 [Brassica carinata]
MLIKVKGETPTLPEQEDRDTNLVDASKNLNPNPGEVNQDVISGEEQDVKICVEEKKELPYFNPPLNILDISLNDLEELVDAMGEWTQHIGALDVRVDALEEQFEEAGNKMEALEDRCEEVGYSMKAIDKTEAYVEKVVAALEGQDKELGNKTEAYVEKVGEDSHEDEKKGEKKGKGVKRTDHTLDDNLSRTMTKSARSVMDPLATFHTTFPCSSSGRESKLESAIGVYALLNVFEWSSHIPRPLRLYEECCAHGSPSTQYLKGAQYFFLYGFEEEGIALIKTTADKGFKIALYTYAMVRKAFWDDEEYFSRFDRDDIRKISMPSSSDSSSDTSADSPSDTSADSPSVALIPTPSDAVSERSSPTSVRRVANVISSGPDSCPAAPPVGYTAIFRAYCSIGFRQNLSWIMVELCGLFRIAPSQLTLCFWGLIHALQVLSDLSGVHITGESPEDPLEWTWFPYVLFNLDSNLRDTAFLLHPDIIQLTSLASTDEHLFIPEHSIDALIAARVHFDTLSLVSSRSVERPPSQLCPDASSSQDPTDSAENPPSSKCPRR